MYRIDIRQEIHIVYYQELQMVYLGDQRSLRQKHDCSGDMDSWSREKSQLNGVYHEGSYSVVGPKGKELGI